MEKIPHGHLVCTDIASNTLQNGRQDWVLMSLSLSTRVTLFELPDKLSKLHSLDQQAIRNGKNA